MILVTGGTGLVGAHLLYKLSQNEPKIRAIYRSESKIEKTRHVFSYYTNDIESHFNKIEWVNADLNDLPSMELAFKDVERVYHAAALVSFDPNDYKKLRRINIEGTANVVNICLEHGIKKLCYVSSVAALGKELSGFITEKSQWNPELDNSVYAITKYGSEMEVWRGSQEGLKVVIVNPGIIIGAGFWKLGSGALFRKTFKGLKYFTKGTTGFVDISDVIDIIISLMEGQITNERYILVSENLKFKEFFEVVAQCLKVSPPKKEAKNWLLQIAWRMDWLNYFFTRKHRKFTKQLAKSVSSSTHYSSEKIKSDLNYKFKPIAESVAETSKLFLRDLGNRH